MQGFLDYVPGDSPLHRFNPATKLLMALLLCTASFASGSILFCAGMIALYFCMACSAGIQSRVLAMLSALVKFCSVLFVLQILFVKSGKILLSLPCGLAVTDLGLRFSLLLVLHLIGGTLPLAMMLSVTKMSAFSGVLVEKMGVPYKYAFALTTAIRFIPVFAGEMAGIMETQTARGVTFDTKNIFKKIGLILPLCVPLLVTSVKKIDGAATSAELRGFNLRGRQSGSREYPFRAADAAALLSCAALIVVSLAI